MKRKLLTASSVVSYIFTFIYAIVTALCFSVNENIYWLFLALMLVSVCIGLYNETIKRELYYNNELSKKHRIVLIVLSVLSVINFPAFIFDILVLTNKCEDKYIKVMNPNYKEKEVKQKTLFKSAPFILAIVALSCIIVFSIVGCTVETLGGDVEVTDLTLTKEETDLYNKNYPLNGTSYTIEDPTVKVSYTVYRPKDASATNPYPVVFVVPGFTRTKATMSQYAIELCRRGAVVFTIDPGSQGGTTYGGYEVDENGEYVVDEAGNKTQNSYSVARSGMGYLLQYVYNNVEEYDYIDRDAIGLVGHSAGGGDAAKLAADFAGNSYEESIVKALYISGYIKTSAANVFNQLRCNTAMSYAKYDEGEFRYQDENQAYEIIALRFINEVNSKTFGANGRFNYFIHDFAYGNVDLGTYRIIHNEETNHCFEMYDAKSITNTIHFFKTALKLETSLEDSSQIWLVKEVSTGISLASAFMLVLALVCLIVKYVPFMKSLKEAGDARLEAEKQLALAYSLEDNGAPKKEMTWGKRLLFWLPMILTAIIACLDYIPLARLSMDLFPDAAGNVYTFYFPARMMNAVFLWAVINGAVGLVVWALTTAGENLYYIISSKITGKECKADWSKFKGLAVKPLDLLKALGLAVLMFLVFYGILQIVYMLTHQDFRFMLISAAPLQKRFVVTWLIYLAGFYVFYLSNSIRVNLGIAREGFKEWQVMLIGGLANSLGLVFIIIINYFPYFTTGTVFYGFYSPTDLSEMWLYINMVFGLIPMMFILPIFNRIVYKKTGNVYAAALLWCMIFIMMSLSASISFIPM